MIVLIKWQERNSSLRTRSSLCMTICRQLIITGIETGNETKRNETQVTSTVPHLTAIGFSYTVYTPQCKVNEGVSRQTFVYPLKIAFYLYKYVTT